MLLPFFGDFIALIGSVAVFPCCLIFPLLLTAIVRLLSLSGLNIRSVLDFRKSPLERPFATVACCTGGGPRPHIAQCRGGRGHHDEHPLGQGKRFGRLQVHKGEWSSMRTTLHWIGVVLTTLMCIASSIAAVRFIIIDAKVCLNQARHR